MIRRAAIGITLAVFLMGAFAEAASAETLPLIKHNSTVVITDVSFPDNVIVVQGDVRSRYRPCTQRRRVGLFQNGEQVGSLTRTANNGTFTLTAPNAPGDYQVIAFKHARDCNHLCRIARTTIPNEPVG